VAHIFIESCQGHGIGGWPLCVQFLMQLTSPAVGGRNGDLEMSPEPKPKRKREDLTLKLKVTTWRQLDRAAKLQNMTQVEVITDALDSYVALLTCGLLLKPIETPE
jgi:hypothetical protein